MGNRTISQDEGFPPPRILPCIALGNCCFLTLILLCSAGRRFSCRNLCSGAYRDRASSISRITYQPAIPCWQCSAWLARIQSSLYLYNQQFPRVCTGNTNGKTQMLIKIKVSWADQWGLKEKGDGYGKFRLFSFSPLLLFIIEKYLESFIS